MSLEEFNRDIMRCFKCGGCTFGYGSFMPSCPSGERYGFMSYYARGRIDMAYALLNKKLDWSEKLLHILYSCVDCKMCADMCTEQTSVRNLDVIMEMKHEAIEGGSVPVEIRDYLESVDRYGNPYNKSRQKRGEWSQDLGVEQYSGQEFLFFVGCVGSYDDVGQRSSKAFAEVLLKAGVPFGILGSEESCDGNEVNRLGETGLFEVLAEKNIALFKAKGVSKIVTNSPHSYNAIKNEYPQYGGDFEVYHSTQLLRDLIKKGSIKPGELKSKVTYHDSCWLGRRNDVYDEPREVLKAVSGLELIEMPRNRGYSFCCGGGGGNFITDFIGSGSVEAPARIRVREAVETGAEIMAVACPICALMFEDAVKSEGLEDKISVKDVCEIINNSMMS